MKKIKQETQDKLEKIVIDHRFQKSIKNPIAELKKAAAKILNDLHKNHFNKKGHGWPLSYSFYKEEIFHEAFGHHLEDYLLNELIKKGCYNLESSPSRGLRIVKCKRENNIQGTKKAKKKVK